MRRGPDHAAGLPQAFGALNRAVLMFLIVLKEATKWFSLAICCILTFFFFDDLKAGAAYTLALVAPNDQSADAPADGPRPLSGATTTADSSDKSSGGGVELRAGRAGHFETSAEVNGRSIEVLVDTGATLVALTFEDAERAGIYVKDADFTQQSQTANGLAKFAPVVLDRVSIGDITVRNVRASVAEPGRLHVTLLGMTFLSKLSRTEMRGGTLVLYE
jgi:aspartyl protease family protein